MPPEKTIPFELPGFEIAQVDQYEDTVVIHAHSATTFAICPYCGQSSGSVHSYYTRSPRDLPSSGYRIRLMLGVRRFCCPNEACDYQTFAERIPQIVPVHGQRTRRLTAAAGTRISRHLKMSMSADTLLRIIRRTYLAPAPTPRVLGVDDWAVKKGNKYGTILVDLEQHRPVDLLADRTAETLAAWLKAHPGIEIVSRDRANEYIAGINEGAPQATQVADRWHLLRNLSEALQRLLEKHAQMLRAAAQQVRTATDISTDDENTEAANEIQALSSHRELRFAEVKRLATEGHSHRTIARQLKMSRNTIKRYLDFDELPKYPLRGPRASAITPYVAHLEARWAEGCHNSRILWEEIRQQGYPGSYGSVRRFVRRYRSKNQQASPSTTPTLRPLSPRQATWLLVLAPSDLSPELSAYRDALCQLCPPIATAYPLAQRFVTMIKQRQAERLDPWLADAQASPISQLKSFAGGLLRDYNAVRAALTLEWSNGQVEGQVNRLKVIKRMMYGRANFDLLRLRVLHPP